MTPDQLGPAARPWIEKGLALVGAVTFACFGVAIGWADVIRYWRTRAM